MSKGNNEKADLANAPSAPSAPAYGGPSAPDYSALDPSAPFSHRAPPPSYEETQRMSGAAVMPGQPQYPPYGQPQYPQAGPSGFQTAPSSSYPAGGPYQWQPPPPMQQQVYYQPNYPAVQTHVSPMMTMQATPYATPSDQAKVLTLAKGAKVRTTATGAVSIPPPPPGCAPTPAQYAAMQGQPVVVKKTPKGFF